MERTAALLRNVAEVREGLLFVVGGGVTRLLRPSFPAPLGLMVAATAEIPPDKVDLVHSFRVVVKDPMAALHVVRLERALQVRAPVGLGGGEPLLVPIVFDVRLVALPQPGPSDVHVEADDGSPRVLGVRAPPPPPATPASSLRTARRPRCASQPQRWCPVCGTLARRRGGWPSVARSPSLCWPGPVRRTPARRARSSAPRPPPARQVARRSLRARNIWH